MSSSLTSRLKIFKADPGSGEPVDVAKLNQGFDKIDAAVGPADVTSTTRPATPYANQIIRESDTGRLYVRNDTDGRWDQILVGGPVRLKSSVDVERDTTGQTFFNGYVAGDANPRITVLGGGSINWGAGGTQDVNLGRAGADLLQTDDAFNAVAGLRSFGNHVTGAEGGMSGSPGTGVYTTSSTSYASLPATSSFTINKRRSDTRLKIFMSFILFSDTAGSTGVGMGALIDGTDYDIFRGYITTTGEYVMISGFGYVSGIGTGNKTVQARWKRTAGTGVLTANGAASLSWLCFSATEVQ